MAPAPMAGSTARVHGGAWLAKAAEALPWHPAPERCREGGRRTPSSQDTLGCLFMGVGDFVESQVRAGKRPALHHQPNGGLGLCHPQRNSGGKNCNPWQGAGSIFSSPPGSSNTPPPLLKKKKKN